MFNTIKDSLNKLIIFFICFCSIIVFLSIIILIKISKPSVVNNNNNNNTIEHVDALVIPDSSEPIISDIPFTDKTSDVTVYYGYESKDISYFDMNYATPVFKYIPIKINDWAVNKDIQEKLYYKCKKYNINYIQALAIMYKEGARNNQYLVHTNFNGTKDIGIMQFNSSNTDILLLMTQSSDIEWLKDIDVNLECACYLIHRNETYLSEVQSLYDSLVVYNGGLKTLRKIKSGDYTLQSPASLYAAKVICYMDELYSWYLNNGGV